MVTPTKTARVDPQESTDRLLRDLRTRRDGLSRREAERRTLVYGTNELIRHRGRTWPRQLLRQFTHPLALLLWMAAVLAVFSGSAPLGVAIVIVILLNAAFAFVQERHAEQAVEALAAFLPTRARVARQGTTETVDVRSLVPGDVIFLTEGDRVSADARLLPGSLEMGLAFIPLGTLMAGLSLDDSVNFDRAPGRQRAGGPTADDHVGSRGGRAYSRQTGRPGQTSLRCGNTRLHQRHLYRQDRHPDHESDAYHQVVDP